MITTILLDIVYGFMWIIILPLTLLPNATLNPNITTAITTVNSYLTTINDIFPIPTLIICLSIVLVTELAILTYKGIKWIRKLGG